MDLLVTQTQWHLRVILRRLEAQEWGIPTVQVAKQEDRKVARWQRALKSLTRSDHPILWQERLRRRDREAIVPWQKALKRRRLQR